MSQVSQVSRVGRRPYQWVTLRCVPRPEREEFLNVGVILYCQADGYLGTASSIRESRLAALDPDLDLSRLRTALLFVESVCAGGPTGAPAQPLGTRFGFLRAPRSTVLQPGPVHGGTTEDPAAELQRLLTALVR